MSCGCVYQIHITFLTSVVTISGYYINLVHHRCQGLTLVGHAVMMNLTELLFPLPIILLQNQNYKVGDFAKSEINISFYHIDMVLHTCASGSPPRTMASPFAPPSSSDDSVIGSSCLPGVELRVVKIEIITIRHSRLHRIRYY